MNEMLDFVKAVSHPDRLRIIGLLAQGPAAQAEIAMRLNLPANESLNHLAYLEHAGAVLKTGDTFALNDDRLAALAREKLSEQRSAYIPDEELDEKSKKVLKAHLNPDGSIRQIPAPPKIQVILDYLIRQFEPSRNYTEREVNIILKRFHEDIAGLRRDLVDKGLLARESDGSRYWRVEDRGK